MSAYECSDETAACALEATGDYRVLRRLPAREIFAEPDGNPVKIGVIIDTETTGLVYPKDELIELTMLKFEYRADGTIERATDLFTALRQPSVAITAEITALTGITNDMVDGQSIPHGDAHAFIKDAAVIIAHHADFDRKFAERELDSFAKHAWACTHEQIDWKAEGLGGSKLEYLLAAYGMFHNGHSSVDDCRAVLEVLSRRLPKSGEIGLKRLLDTARRATVRIWAGDTKFTLKEQLKEHGYLWSGGTDGRPKAWWKEVPEDMANDEMDFLRKHIYRQLTRDIPFTRLTAFERFSERA